MRCDPVRICTKADSALFRDSIPTAIPVGNGSDYTFVQTGIVSFLTSRCWTSLRLSSQHVFGTSSVVRFLAASGAPDSETDRHFQRQYGQDYNVCE